MNEMDWGFSSSSGSDSDDDRPVSKLRTDTQFYQHFQNDEFGADWPTNLRFGHSSQHLVETNNFNASRTNGAVEIDAVANSSHNISGSNGSRVISMADLETTPVEIVLIKEGGKFRPVRVIQPSEIIPPRNTPDKPKQEPNESLNELAEDNSHVPPEIPLERNEFIPIPIDPRVNATDYCYLSDDMEFPLPRFWREVIIKTEQDRNLERNGQLNGSFKRNMALVRQRALERSQRFVAAGRRPDPRLERSLFEPPRKVDSPAKPHNQTQPNMNASIFDCDNIEDVSSDSSSSSLSTLPSADDRQYRNHNSTAINNHGMESFTDSDDLDYSFSSFNKRKLLNNSNRNAKRQKLSDSEDEKVPAIKIDLKNSKVTIAKDKEQNKQKDLLLKPPPTLINAQDILNALSDDTESEGQENASINISEIKASESTSKKTVAKTKKISPPQKKKMTIAPIAMVNNAARSKPTEIRDISPDSTISNDSAMQTEKKNVNVESDKAEADAKNADRSDELVKQQPPDMIVEASSPKFSDASSTSMCSIEQRLAEMASPVKHSIENRSDENNAQLADILSDTHKVAETMNISKTSSGHDSTEEPSPAFESIVDSVNKSPDKNNQMPDISSTAPDNVSTATVQSTDRPEIGSQTSTASTNASIPEKPTIDVQENPAKVNDESVAANQGNTSKSSNSSFGVPEIGATEIFGASENINLDDYTKDLDSSLEDIGRLIENPLQPNIKGSKVKRARIIINDYLEPPCSKVIDVDDSDDDFENDVPCGMDELMLPHSNTDRNAVDKLVSKCLQCSYEAPKGWKQLTKHYVRKHPGKEIPISRLAKQYSPQELMELNPIAPMITKSGGSIMIQSLCYICNEAYNMCSSKWLMHFIAHTGEFEFQCKKCKKAISQDLHKECNTQDNDRINGPHDFNDNTLYGYVCACCKYVQLAKKNVTKHLVDEHQQLSNEENVIEIVLLKISHPIDLLADDKNAKSLLDAKHRMSVIQSTKRYERMEMHLSSDEEIISNHEDNDIPQVDLTLTDDEL